MERLAVILTIYYCSSVQEAAAEHREHMNLHSNNWETRAPLVATNGLREIQWRVLEPQCYHKLTGYRCIVRFTDAAQRMMYHRRDVYEPLRDLVSHLHSKYIHE